MPSKKSPRTERYNLTATPEEVARLEALQEAWNVNSVDAVHRAVELCLALRALAPLDAKRLDVAVREADLSGAALRVLFAVLPPEGAGE